MSLMGRLGDDERPPTQFDKLVGGYTTTANFLRQLRFLLVVAVTILAVVYLIKLIKGI